MAVAPSAVVDHLRRSFKTGKTLPVSYRLDQLRRFQAMIEENSDEFCQAAYDDIRRPKAEAYCYELILVLNEVKLTLSELRNWTKPKKVERALLQIMDEAEISAEPYGVVLIIAPWNYPLYLCLQPMVGAIAAGNCILLKPSEVAPTTSSVLQRLIHKYMDPDVIRVVQGGIPETSELLRQKFDYIFFTGAPSVGKIVYEAAAKQLIPVTLELGGKSPVILDETSDIETAACRLVWGKYLSLGQTCIAPDYVLCVDSVKEKFLENVVKCIKKYYGDDARISKDYARIINERHFDRVMKLIQTTKGSVVYGGKHDRADNYIEPTVIDNLKPSDPVMQEEIFGPIMPVLSIKNFEEAIDFINEREKPLALYIFTKNRARADDVILRTSSGSVCVNDVIVQQACDSLPFGGVGNSGMGRSRGHFSFQSFSHEKGVLRRKQTGESILWFRYPPMDNQKVKFARFLATRRALPNLTFLKYLPTFVIGFMLAYFIQFWIGLPVSALIFAENFCVGLVPSMGNGVLVKQRMHILAVGRAVFFTSPL